MISLKELLPPTAISAVRLVRTRASVEGWHDRDEARGRREALRRMAAQPLAPASGPPFLIFSFRGWYPHTAWESIIAHALRLRGVPIHIFNCGGELPICEVNFRGARPALACRECVAYPDTIVEGLGMPRSLLRQYISERERQEISDAVNRLHADEYAGWRWREQPIGALVRDSVFWFTRKSTCSSPADIDVYRQFLIAGAHLALVTPRLLEATRPRAVLQLNGRFFAERIFNQFVPSSVPVATYECGWRRDTLGFDRLSENGFADLDRPWLEWADRPLTAGENETLDDWISSRAAGDMQRDFYIKFSTEGGENPLAALKLDPDRPTAVLFTNLVWDTAVLGRDDAFGSIREWLVRTVEEFRARHDWQLIIRIHPAEDLRPSQPSAERLQDVVDSLGELAPNIRLVPSTQSLSSYALMDSCRATLVYTSTAGLEAALRRRPVVVTARTYYRNRGFTIDVRDAADYRAQLEDAMLNRQTDVQLERARRFAYLLLFRYLKRIPVVHQRPGRFPILAPSEVDDLLPGRLPEFDRLLDALVAGGPFV